MPSSHHTIDIPLSPLVNDEATLGAAVYGLYISHVRHHFDTNIESLP